MTSGTICPPDCPARTATCHCFCKTYLAAWEENQRRYAQKERERKISDVSTVGINVRMKEMHKKQKQI